MYKNNITSSRSNRLVLHCSSLLFITILAVLISATMASEDSRIVKANNQFGMDLFRIVAKGDENKLISPLSAHVVLSMAYQGTGGETTKNMAKVFHLPDPETTANEYHKVVSQLTKVSNVTLDIANKIYIKQKFELKPAFKEIIEKKFLSEAEEIKFTDSENAAKEINSWVENKTNKKITELIKPDMLNADTRLVLLNAVYFKGNWSLKFDAKDTEKKPFYLLNGDEIQVDMMHKSAKYRYSENEELNCKILELPYKGDELSMVVFLPNERTGIKQLQEKLATVDFASILQGLHQFTVNLQLPKFKIESEIPLKDALVELGAKNMFTDEADFSNMAAEPLKVSDVIQKTFIEVNEEGAEAAAATGMIMMTRCMPMPVPKIPFNVDHPFTFALINRAEGKKSLLFFGKVVQP